LKLPGRTILTLKNEIVKFFHSQKQDRYAIKMTRKTTAVGGTASNKKEFTEKRQSQNASH